MDDESRQALGAMEARIVNRLEETETQVLKRFEKTEAGVAKRFEETEARIMKRFEETDEKIREVETNLLSAFHGWSTTMELRLKSLPATEQRLSVIEDRVSAIERRLLEKGM